jgi:hypothetical protein
MPEQWLSRFIMLTENNIEAGWKTRLIERSKSLRSSPETKLIFNPLNTNEEDSEVSMSTFLE